MKKYRQSLKYRTYHRLVSSRRWSQLRGKHLSAHPLCADCESAGRVRLASEVHHVVPVMTADDCEGMKALAFDAGNLVSLCADCHRERHEASERGIPREVRKARIRANAARFVEKWTGAESPGV